MRPLFQDMVTDPKFQELVRQDAECIVDRQATDTIDIVDEIRFVLRNGQTAGLRSLSDIRETNAKLGLLDKMLEELGFETFS